MEGHGPSPSPPLQSGRPIIILKHFTCILFTLVIDAQAPPASPQRSSASGYGNFDIIFDHYSRIPQLHPTQHIPCALLYLVTMLIGC